MIVKTVNRVNKIIYFLLKSKRFQSFHYSSKIIKPIIITPKYIHIGKNVKIYHHGRIQGIFKEDICTKPPLIKFEDNTTCQQNLHLTCAESIFIGKNTAIAANVTITDINHPYENINIPIEKQKWVINPVIIGEDSKIYNNSVLLPGTKLGKHTTVGANSVVSGEFPDFCVIAGSPAKIIKRYNYYKNQWMRTNANGEFLNE